MLCLGIESSCDETALALVKDGKLLDAVVASQADVHALFGGVVPELASREHYRFIGALYDELMQRNDLSLDDVDSIAVTRGPGLLGALLVGVAFAKGLAFGGNKVLIGVDHLQAHLLVTGLTNPLTYPALGLLVSGGHTHIYRIDDPLSFTLLGKTLDDAAGEACDKFAKLLGLPYPGGAILDRLAQQGTAEPKRFPRPYTKNKTLDFSFSGLKTAAATWLHQYPEVVINGQHVRRDGEACATQALKDVCASYLYAVADTLRIKLEQAVAIDKQAYPLNPVKSLVLAGGVAANSQVRLQLTALAQKLDLPLLIPPPKHCTDNAVMIAYTGFLWTQHARQHDLALSAIPRGQHVPIDFKTF